eukprot:105372_1
MRYTIMAFIQKLFVTTVVFIDYRRVVEAQEIRFNITFTTGDSTGRKYVYEARAGESFLIHSTQRLTFEQITDGDKYQSCDFTGSTMVVNQTGYDSNDNFVYNILENAFDSVDSIYFGSTSWRREALCNLGVKFEVTNELRTPAPIPTEESSELLWYEILAIVLPALILFGGIIFTIKHVKEKRKRAAERRAKQQKRANAKRKKEKAELKEARDERKKVNAEYRKRQKEIAEREKAAAANVVLDVTECKSATDVENSDVETIVAPEMKNATVKESSSESDDTKEERIEKERKARKKARAKKKAAMQARALEASLGF